MRPHRSSALMLKWPLPGPSRPVHVRARRWPRATAPFTVRVSGNTSEVGWRGINLSPGGMLCMAAEPWWPGSDMIADLDLSPPVRVHGRVVELVGHGDHVAMRVCFAALEGQAHDQISHWVAAQAAVRSRDGEPR